MVNDETFKMMTYRYKVMLTPVKKMELYVREVSLHDTCAPGHGIKYVDENEHPGIQFQTTVRSNLQHTHNSNLTNVQTALHQATKHIS